VNEAVEELTEIPAALDPAGEISQSDPIPDGFGDAVSVANRLREAAPEYHGRRSLVAKTQAEAEAIRERLATDFAIYKAIHVGKGRDGNWGPFIEELGFAARTVDRWVSNKLASGQLPEWVAERLIGNQDPPPPPPPPPPPRLKLEIPMSVERQQQFMPCLERLGPQSAEVIFEAVINHPNAQPVSALLLDEPDTLSGAM
jgi:hypothetical protein